MSQVRPTVSRRVGVLGGMGPAATVDFYGKLVEETPAGRDQDHLPVVIWADPRVPDRSESLLGTGEDPTPWLERGIEALVEAGCDVLAVPCNTAHAFVPRLARQAGVQLVSIVEATVDTVVAEGAVTVGLLATTGTVRSRLYADSLQQYGIEVIEPLSADQERVMAAILAVKRGRAGRTHRRALADVCRGLADQGAELVIAACTELVLVLEPDGAVPVVDPARLLARRVVTVALAGT